MIHWCIFFFGTIKRQLRILGCNRDGHTYADFRRIQNDIKRVCTRLKHATALYLPDNDQSQFSHRHVLGVSSTLAHLAWCNWCFNEFHNKSSVLQEGPVSTSQVSAEWKFSFKKIKNTQAKNKHHHTQWKKTCRYIHMLQWLKIHSVDEQTNGKQMAQLHNPPTFREEGLYSFTVSIQYDEMKFCINTLTRGWKTSAWL